MRARAHVCLCVSACVRVYIWACGCMYACVDVRRCVRVSMRGCTGVCVRCCVRVLTHARARAHVRACVCASPGNAGVVVAGSDCGDFALGPLDGRDCHREASAQTHAKHETLVASFSKTGSGFAKKWRPVFGLCFAAAITSSSINRNQKTDAVFRSSSVFLRLSAAWRGGGVEAVRRQ